METEEELGFAYTMDPEILNIRPIVKLFVIQNSEGYWFDCGAGEASLVINPNHSVPLQPKDLTIIVQNSLEDSIERDYLPPDREKRLKGDSTDKLITLSVNFENAKEFCKSQSTLLLTQIQSSTGSSPT